MPQVVIAAGKAVPPSHIAQTNNQSSHELNRCRRLQKPEPATHSPSTDSNGILPSRHDDAHSFPVPSQLTQEVLHPPLASLPAAAASDDSSAIVSTATLSQQQQQQDVSPIAPAQRRRDQKSAPASLRVRGSSSSEDEIAISVPATVVATRRMASTPTRQQQQQPVVPSSTHATTHATAAGPRRTSAESTTARGASERADLTKRTQKSSSPAVAGPRNTKSGGSSNSRSRSSPHAGGSELHDATLLAGAAAHSPRQQAEAFVVPGSPRALSEPPPVGRGGSSPPPSPPLRPAEAARGTMGLPAASSPLDHPHREQQQQQQQESQRRVVPCVVPTPYFLNAVGAVNSSSRSRSSSESVNSIIVQPRRFTAPPAYTVSPPHPRSRATVRVEDGLATTSSDEEQGQAPPPVATATVSPPTPLVQPHPQLLHCPPAGSRSSGGSGDAAAAVVGTAVDPPALDTSSPASLSRLQQSARRSLVGPPRAATNSPDSQLPPLTDMTHAPSSQEGDGSSSWDVTSLAQTAASSVASTAKGSVAAARRLTQRVVAQEHNREQQQQRQQEEEGRSSSRLLALPSTASLPHGRPVHRSILRSRKKKKKAIKARLGRGVSGGGPGSGSRVSNGSARSARTAGHREERPTQSQSETLAAGVAATAAGGPAKTEGGSRGVTHDSRVQTHVPSPPAASVTLTITSTTAAPADMMAASESATAKSRVAGAVSALSLPSSPTTPSAAAEPQSSGPPSPPSPPQLPAALEGGSEASRAAVASEHTAAQPPPTTRAPTALRSSVPLHRRDFLLLSSDAVSSTRNDAAVAAVTGQQAEQRKGEEEERVSQRMVSELSDGARHSPVAAPAAVAVVPLLVGTTLHSPLSSHGIGSASPPPSSALLHLAAPSHPDSVADLHSPVPLGTHRGLPAPTLAIPFVLEHSPSRPRPVPPQTDGEREAPAISLLTTATTTTTVATAATTTTPAASAYLARNGEISVPLLTAMLAMPTLHASRGDLVFSSPGGAAGSAAAAGESASATASELQRRHPSFFTGPLLVPEASQEFFVRAAQRMGGYGNIAAATTAHMTATTTTTTTPATRGGAAANHYPVALSSYASSSSLQPQQHGPSQAAAAAAGAAALMVGEGVPRTHTINNTDNKAIPTAVARRIQLEDRERSQSSYPFNIRSTSSVPHPLMALVLDAGRQAPTPTVVVVAEEEGERMGDSKVAPTAAAAAAETHAVDQEQRNKRRASRSGSSSNSHHSDAHSVHTQASVKDECVPTSPSHSVDGEGNLIIYKPTSSVAAAAAESVRSDEGEGGQGNKDNEEAARGIEERRAGQPEAAPPLMSQSPTLEAAAATRPLGIDSAKKATVMAHHSKGNANSWDSGSRQELHVFSSAASSAAAAAAAAAAAPKEFALVPPSHLVPSPTPLMVDLVPGLTCIPSSTDMSSSVSSAAVHSPQPRAPGAMEVPSPHDAAMAAAVAAGAKGATANLLSQLSTQLPRRDSLPASPPTSIVAAATHHLAGDRYRYGSTTSPSPVPYPRRQGPVHATPRTPSATGHESQLSSSSHPSGMQASSAVSGHSMPLVSEEEGSSMWSASLPPPPPPPPLRFADMHTQVAAAAAAAGQAQKHAGRPLVTPYGTSPSPSSPPPSQPAAAAVVVVVAASEEEGGRGGAQREKSSVGKPASAAAAAATPLSPLRTARTVLRQRDDQAKTRRPPKVPAPAAVRSSHSDTPLATTATRPVSAAVTPSLHAQPDAAVPRPEEWRQSHPRQQGDDAVPSTTALLPSDAVVAAAAEVAPAPPSPRSSGLQRLRPASSAASLLHTPQTVEPSQSLCRPTGSNGGGGGTAASPPLAPLQPSTRPLDATTAEAEQRRSQPARDAEAASTVVADALLPLATLPLPMAASPRAPEAAEHSEEVGGFRRSRGQRTSSPPPLGETAAAASSPHANRRLAVRAMPAGERTSRSARKKHANATTTKRTSSSDTNNNNKSDTQRPVLTSRASHTVSAEDKSGAAASATLAPQPPSPPASSTIAGAGTGDAAECATPQQLQEMAPPPTVATTTAPSVAAVVPRALPLYHIQSPPREGVPRYTSVSPLPSRGAMTNTAAAPPHSSPPRPPSTPASVQSGQAAREPLPSPASRRVQQQQQQQHGGERAGDGTAAFPTAYRVELHALPFASPYSRAPTYNRPLATDAEGPTSSTQHHRQGISVDGPRTGGPAKATRRTAATQNKERSREEHREAKDGARAEAAPPLPLTPRTDEEEEAAAAPRSPPRRASRFVSYASVKRTPHHHSGAGWAVREAQLANTPGTELAPSVIPGKADSRASSPDAGALLAALGEWSPVQQPQMGQRGADGAESGSNDDAERGELDDGGDGADDGSLTHNTHRTPQYDDGGGSRRIKKKFRIDRSAARRLRPQHDASLPHRQPPAVPGTAYRTARGGAGKAARPAASKKRRDSGGKTRGASATSSEPVVSPPPPPALLEQREKEHSPGGTAAHTGPHISGAAAASSDGVSRRTAATSPSHPPLSHAKTLFISHDRHPRQALAPASTAATTRPTTTTAAAATVVVARAERRAAGTQTDPAPLPRTTALPHFTSDGLSPQVTAACTAAAVNLPSGNGVTPSQASTPHNQRAVGQFAETDVQHRLPQQRSSHQGSAERVVRPMPQPPAPLSAPEPFVLPTSSCSSPATTHQRTPASSTPTGSNGAAAAKTAMMTTTPSSSPPPAVRAPVSASPVGAAGPRTAAVVREVLTPAMSASLLSASGARPSRYGEGGESPMPQQVSVASSCLQEHQRQAGYRSHLPRTLPSMALTPDPVHLRPEQSPPPAVRARPRSMDATEYVAKHGEAEQRGGRGTGAGHSSSSRQQQQQNSRSGRGGGGSVWGRMGALGQKLIPLWWKGRRHRRSGSSESSRNSSSSKIISGDGSSGGGRGEGRSGAGEEAAATPSSSSPQQQQQQRHRLHDTPSQEAPSRTVPPLLSATHQTPQYRHTPTHRPLPAPTYSSSSPSASASVPKPQGSKSSPRRHTRPDEEAAGGAWRSREVPEGVPQTSTSYPRGSPRPDSGDHHQLQQQQRQRHSSGLGAFSSGLPSPLAASPPPQQQLRWGRVASSAGTPSPLPTAPAAPPTPPAGYGLSAFDDYVANSTSATAGQSLNRLPSSLPTVSVSGGSLQSNAAAATYYGAYQRSVHGGSGGVGGGGAVRGATPSLRTSYSPLQFVTPHRAVPVAAAPPPLQQQQQQQQQQPEPRHCPPVLPRVASRRPGDGQRTPSDIASNTVCAPAGVDCAVPLQAPLPRARNVPFHSSNSRTRNHQQQQQQQQQQRDDLCSGSARDEPVVEDGEGAAKAPRLTRELLERYQRAQPSAAAPTRVVPESDTPPKNSRHDLPQPTRQRRHTHEEARASPAAAAPVDHDSQPYLTNPRYAMEQRRALQATQPRALLVEEVRESVSPVRRPPLLSSPARGRERAGASRTTTKPSSPPPAVSASHPASAGRVAAAGPGAGRAGDLLRGTAVRRAASPAAVSPSSFSPQPGLVQRDHAHSPSPAPVAPTNYSSSPRQQQQQQRATGAAAGVALPAVSRPVVYPQHHRGAGRYAATPLAHASGHYGAHGSTVQQGGPLPPLLHPAMYGLRSDVVPTQEPPRTWLKPELEAAGEERSACGPPGQQQQLQRASSLLRGLRAEKEQRQGRRGNLMR